LDESDSSKRLESSHMTGKSIGQVSEMHKKEAGFIPNELRGSFDEDFLLEKLVGLTREVGRLPTDAHLLMQRHKDPQFPSRGAFVRLGTKSQMAAKLIGFCESQPGNEDVVQLCVAKLKAEGEPENTEAIEEGSFGYVYLFKSGVITRLGILIRLAGAKAN
jgi:hypothetical protein